MADVYEITEVCPHCDREVTMTWDVKEDGYKAFCPYCGGRLMLCDECRHQDGVFCDQCNYDSKTGTCKHNPPREMVIISKKDGSWYEYNSEFDVTIHCENEKDMDNAVQLLHLANRLHWRRTAENPPTKADADERGYVLSVAQSGGFKDVVEAWHFYTVALIPDEYPIWMPLPKIQEDLKGEKYNERIF